MNSGTSAPAGLSIRLVPDVEHEGHWAVAVRNDGPATLRDAMVYVSEGGIPSPGDLGSSYGWRHPLDQLGPSEECRLGSFHFVPGGDYLDLPLSVSLCSRGCLLLYLNVTTGDLDRLGTLRGAEPIPPGDSEEEGNRAGRRPWWSGFRWLRRRHPPASDA